MKTLCIVCLLLLNSAAGAQWRKIRQFYDTGGAFAGRISCIYFIDLPGPPRIGFVGTEPDLYRTSDGGETWSRCWHEYDGQWQWPTSVVFADSLTGWFAYASGYSSVWRTRDGGLHWQQLAIPYPRWPVADLSYNKSMKALLLARPDTSLLYSTDEGDSWSVLPYTWFESFSFFSDSCGLAVNGNEHDMLTTNGGTVWDTLPFDFNYVPNATPMTGLGYPLALPGSQTCFDANGGWIKIFRSDDMGHSWRLLHTFPPSVDSLGNKTGPISTNQIGGTLDHLEIQTDTGLYLSTDEGVTWQFIGGPPAFGSPSPHTLYCAKGKTFAGQDTSVWDSDRGTLYVRDWDAVGGVSAPKPSNAITVSPNPASEFATLSFSLASPSVLKVEVFDILGNRLNREVSKPLDVGDHTETVPLQDLLPGVYYIRAMLSDRVGMTLKLVRY